MNSFILTRKNIGNIGNKWKPFYSILTLNDFLEINNLMGLDYFKLEIKGDHFDYFKILNQIIYNIDIYKIEEKIKEKNKNITYIKESNKIIESLTFFENVEDVIMNYDNKGNIIKQVINVGIAFNECFYKFKYKNGRLYKIISNDKECILKYKG